MNKSIILIITLLLSFTVFSQEKYTISGYVKSAETGEELIGATVYIKSKSIGVSANVYGFYSLTLSEGVYDVSYSYIGYNEQTIKVDLSRNIQKNIELAETVNKLDVVEITGEKADNNFKSIEMSVNKIDSKTIKKIPALLGEADVVKSILLLPGVSTVGEGSTGFNVRGGGIDQNLVLLDEAPVYNSSHLFGFFSVFNPDAVKNVKLIKGGISPEYGGRLSSILDIRMKEGNKKELTGSGGVGVIFSRLSVEGPIVKDKASFLVAGRRSYADVLAKPFLNENLKNTKFYFYDLTAKVNYELNAKNKLFLSGYFGRDVFGSGFIFNWGNATATARWNHIFNEKLFMNLTAFYSDYDYAFGVDEEDPADDFDWNSSIVSTSIKPDFSYYLNNKNTLKFGAQSIYYDFKPAQATFASDGQTSNISLREKYGIENGIYILNEQKIGARTSVLYGLRWSHFAYLGKGIKQTYRDTIPGITKPLDEEISFAKNKSIANYNFFEPRLSVKYDLTEFSSVKASYNRMTQYLHLISNTIASTPVDIWLPTTNNVKPQVADQVAVGYFRNFKNNKYETSVEVFAKDFQNQVDYIDNARIFFNEQLEGDLLSGDGRAFGLELYVKKNTGKLTGWVSYTLSRSERKVNGISNGDWYPNRFDRLHNLSVVNSYELNKKWSFSANFVYSTGTPGTFPTNRYEIQGVVVAHNVDNKRNNFRIPAYHRLDISATLTPKKNEDRKWKGEWVFSIYNVYSRKNPFSIYFEQNQDNPRKTDAIRYAVIGTLVPAVSYNFNF
ncbi:MAG: TonB-dependent receptor [Bacteroidetes bacterium]|nr:MAG: TonB-dependent receptor [Bacteroidota bacterium]MBL1145473.1 TonB-dependent receptor [Bacteroidota bacterium]NOG58271.1 TonB-dependent receptor [Bacteroidota bacterium]